jgi:Helix-turn-helix domain
MAIVNPQLSSPDVMTVRATAQAFGVHENTVRNWVGRGLLGAIVLPSGVRRIPVAEVERLLAEAMAIPTSFPPDVYTPLPNSLDPTAEITIAHYPEV